MAKSKKASAFKGTLLWTNPSPTEAFAAQTIQLPDNDADLFLIQVKYAAGGVYMSSCYVVVPGEDAMFMEPITNNWAVGSFTGAYFRPVSTTQNSIVVSDNRQAGTTGNTVSNVGLVPMRVYGIKY